MKFKVWCPERGQTVGGAWTIVADSPEAAAADWGWEADTHSAEYEIVGGAMASVCVQDPDGLVTRWQVKGEGVPQYYASPEEGAHGGA